LKNTKKGRTEDGALKKAPLEIIDSINTIGYNQYGMKPYQSYLPTYLQRARQ
jgi:hypothetical protein